MRLRSMEMPTQKRDSPRSEISQMELSSSLNLEVSEEQEDPTKKSSTCIPVRMVPEEVVRKYRQYSHFILVKPSPTIPVFIALFHIRDPCGKPYRPFCSSHISHSLPGASNPRGCFIYTSSPGSSLPRRKAVLTSTWCSSQPLTAAMCATALKVSIRIVGAAVSL